MEEFLAVRFIERRVRRAYPLLVCTPPKLRHDIRYRGASHRPVVRVILIHLLILRSMPAMGARGCIAVGGPQLGGSRRPVMTTLLVGITFTALLVLVSIAIFLPLFLSILALGFGSMPLLARAFVDVDISFFRGRHGASY